MSKCLCVCEGVFIDEDADAEVDHVELSCLVVFEVAEGGEHLLVQLIQVLSYLLLALLGRILELHAAQLVQDAAHVLLDGRPRDLVLRLSGRLDGVARRVVEADQVVQHEHRLVERAISFVGWLVGWLVGM